MERKLLIGGGVAAVVVAVVLIVLLLPGKPHKAAAPNNNVASTEAVAPGGPTTRSKAPDIRIDLLPAAPEEKASNAESAALADFTGELITLKPRPMLFISGRVNVAQGSTNAVLQAAYSKIRAYIAAHGLSADGSPFAITDGFNQAANMWSYRAGIALTATPVGPPSLADGIQLGTTYGGAVARFVHIGDPNQAQPTYAKISDWLNAHGLTSGVPTWEEYTSDPSVPVEQWHTNIYIPVG